MFVSRSCRIAIAISKGEREVECWWEQEQVPRYTNSDQRRVGGAILKTVGRVPLNSNKVYRDHSIQGLVSASSWPFLTGKAGKQGWGEGTGGGSWRERTKRSAQKAGYEEKEG
jgi:hypothetical protein